MSASSLFYSLRFIGIIRTVVILEKRKDVFDMMLKYGLIDGLCNIFSTCKDEDTLV